MLDVMFSLLIAVSILSVQVCSQYTNSSSSTTQSATSKTIVSVSPSTFKPYLSQSKTDVFLSIYTRSSVLTVGSYLTTEIATEAVYSEIGAYNKNGVQGSTYTTIMESQVFDAAYTSSIVSRSSMEASKSSADGIVSASCVNAANAFNASNSTNWGSYNPPASCCRVIEPCSIYAEQVEIIYFANGTANSTGNLTYSQESTFVSDAFTFTSPSLYVVYSTLRAIQGNGVTCYGGGTTSVAAQGQQLGGNYTNVTRAYAPGVIKSGHCYHGGIMASDALNPTDLATPLPNSVVVSLPNCINGEFFGYAGNGTELWASPQIALPTDVAQIDPLWSTCIGFAYGAWDPPIALTPARALVTATTDPGSHPTQRPSTAQPQPQVSTPVAGPTSNPPSPTQKPTMIQPSIVDPPSTANGKPNEPSVRAGNSETAAGNSAGGQVSQDPGAGISQPVKSSAGAGGNASPVIASPPQPVQNPTSQAPNQAGQASSQSQPAGIIGPAGSSPQPAPQKSAGQAPPAGKSASGPANAVPNPAQTQNGQGTPETQGSDSTAGNSALPISQSPGGSTDPISNAGGVVIPFPPSSQDGNTELPSVGGQQISAQNGGVVAAGKTVLAGSVVTVSGQKVSVGVGVVAVGSTTYALPGSPAALPQVAGSPVQTLANGGVVIAGTTLSAGGTAAIIQGSVVSVLPSGSGLLVNNQAQPTALVVAGQQVQAAPTGAFIIGSATLSAGGLATTIQGNTVSVLPNGNGLLINGQTQTAPTNIGGQQIKSLSNPPVVIGSVTLSAGGSAATIQGSVVSVLPSGSGLIVNGQTQAIPSNVGPQQIQPLTIAGQQITAAPNGAIIIGSATLSAGGSAATIQGSTISVLPGGSSILINGQTQALSIAQPPQSIFTVGGQTFTANPTAFSFDGTTLQQGQGAVTISGTVVSLGPGGLRIGGSTVPLTATGALGSFIAGAFGTGTVGGSGGVGASATGTGVATFQGRGTRLRMDGWIWASALLGWGVLPGLVVWL